ncbi:hypothetical protein D3C78_1982670 [compost metagenome]
MPLGLVSFKLSVFWSSGEGPLSDELAVWLDLKVIVEPSGSTPESVRTELFLLMVDFSATWRDAPPTGV